MDKNAIYLCNIRAVTILLTLTLVLATIDFAFGAVYATQALTGHRSKLISNDSPVPTPA